MSVFLSSFSVDDFQDFVLTRSMMMSTVLWVLCSLCNFAIYCNAIPLQATLCIIPHPPYVHLPIPCSLLAWIWKTIQCSNLPTSGKTGRAILSEVRLSCLVGRTFLLLVDVHIIVLHPWCNVVCSYLDTCWSRHAELLRNLELTRPDIV